MANDRETENAKSTKGVESLKSSTPSPDVLTHPLGAYSHHSVSTSSAYLAGSLGRLVGGRLS